jgi:hypothetical protein
MRQAAARWPCDHWYTPDLIRSGWPSRHSAELAVAAANYLDAQLELVVTARLADDAGLAVTELHTSWLETPPEEAVIQARVEADQEEARSEQVNDAVNMIMEALRGHGYKPALRVKDVEVHGGGPVPGGNPAQENNSRQCRRSCSSRL